MTATTATGAAAARADPADRGRRRRRAVGESPSAPGERHVEIAGPEQFRLDEFVRRAWGERSAQVVADPEARYFGAELDERTLLPTARPLGEIRFEDWLAQPARVSEE